MKLRASLGALASFLITGPAAAEIQALTYLCERGVTIPAVYVNGEDGPDRIAVVVIQVEGRMINLEASESGSGARYAVPSDKSGYVWWTKGTSATLAWFDAPLREEVTLYAACEAQ
ncbi:MliC family protein [Sulfitobacter sp. LCG007]